MQASDDYQDNDGKCDIGDKGCNGLLEQLEIKKKKIKRIPRPSGNHIELNLMAGITMNAQGYGGGSATVGLLYYSLGLVTDQDGNVQFYYTTIDQVYIPGSSGQTGGYLSGPAERGSPSSAYGIGLTANRGLIYGDGFNTDRFLGPGFSHFLGVGPASGGKFEPHDKSYTGFDMGIGIAGGPISQGSVATDTKPIGDPILLPTQLIPACQMMGQCGSSFPPLVP